MKKRLSPVQTYVYAFIGIAVLLIYLPTLWNGAIWDDDLYLLNNVYLRSLKGLWKIWFEVGAEPQYYPMVYSLFWIQYHLWGFHLSWYHLINVIFHALNSCLLLLVLKRLKVRGALVATILFALHPVQVETVAWITELKNLLSTFFYLLSLLAFVPVGFSKEGKSAFLKSLGCYLASLGFFLFALMSKSITCSLPAAILLLLWWKHGKVRLKEIGLLTPYFVIGSLSGMLTIWMEKNVVAASGSEWNFTWVDRCLIAGRALWFYVFKLLIPVRLTFIYPRFVIDSSQVWQYIFPLSVLALFGSLFLMRKKIGRGPLTAVLFFSGTLVPALGFFNVYPHRYSFVADHFQYLASIGFFVLIAGVVHGIYLKIPGKSRGLILTVASGIPLLLALFTFQQEKIYFNLETLYQDTLSKNPRCWMAHLNLGVYYCEGGKLGESLEHLAKTVELKPDEASAYYNIGIVLDLSGESEKSLAYFEKALELKYDYGEAHGGYATALLKMGKIDKAITHFYKALALSPVSNLAIRCNLGITLVKKGRYDEALEQYRMILQENPDYYYGHYNSGVIYDKMGRYEKASKEYEEALRLNPSYLEAYHNLGVDCFRRGDRQNALMNFQAALRINPDYSPSKQFLAKMGQS